MTKPPFPITGKRFPIAAPEEIRCFNCDSPEGTVLDAGYPPRYGRYRKTCAQCGYHTYFDTPEEVQCAKAESD